MRPNYALQEVQFSGGPAAAASLPAADDSPTAELVRELGRMGVAGAGKLVLAEESLELGEVMSRAGATGAVHFGKLNGRDVSL
ncbi:MAG: hypothetical protein WDW38_001195 [Sanguina aurantia]